MSEIKRMGYYAGAWKQSQATEYFPVTDSSTGEVIAEVPNCTAQECEEAIAAAQEAFPAWSRLSMAKRVQYLFKWREVLYAHKEELSILCAKELGKTLNEARGDVQKAIEPTEEACAAPTMIQPSPSPDPILPFTSDIQSALSLLPSPASPPPDDSAPSSSASSSSMLGRSLLSSFGNAWLNS